MPPSRDDTPDKPDQSDVPGRSDALQALRRVQQRDAARGCLLVGVLELAAVLGGLLYLLGLLAGLPAFTRAGGFAFLAFTAAAVLTLAGLLVLGNTPGQRRLRRDADPLGRDPDAG